MDTVTENKVEKSWEQQVITETENKVEESRRVVVMDK